MAVPFFADIYKLFSVAMRRGPLETLDNDDSIEGVAVTSPDAKWNMQNASWSGAQGVRLQLHDSNDFIDLSSVTNRKSRYKEYERLESIPEIHTALNTFADEACLAGDTLIATPFGFIPLKELAENKKPDERFMVYCWDFGKDDFSIGWAYHPRKVKHAYTVEVMFDNGKRHIVTPDHRFLTADNEWKAAGDLRRGEKLKAFYRIPAIQRFTKMKSRQFARIFTYKDSWIHERQMLDEWKLGCNLEEYDRFNTIARHAARGLRLKQIDKVMNLWRKSITLCMEKQGFTFRELTYLNKRYAEYRTVVAVCRHKEVDVYDLSVEEHANFATDSTIVHNCQTDDEGFVFKIKCAHPEVKEEANFLVHNLLDLDTRAWGIERNLCKLGDHFWEVVIDPNNPKRGILKVQNLPADSIYRIETVKGRVVEYQQSQEGPDYQALTRVDITKATQSQLMEATAIRFHPDQIVHGRIGDDRKLFYPYGVSVIEAARGPAHQLRLMEDAMLTYRLTHSVERRVYYIDTNHIAPNRVEAMMDRLQDQLRKKKVFSRKKGSAAQGASAVEERWNPTPPGEDIFIPVRTNSQTRIETLPGPQALGEIDDAMYFRQRLFTALQFPKNYLTNEDPSATRLTLSQQDVRFARFVERLQKPLARSVREVVVRHLHLRGFPEEVYRDLEVHMTPPSDWRQINRNEVTEVLFGRAATLKGAQLMSDYDILVKILGYDEDDAKEIVARTKAQKWDDLRLAALGQNPQLMGLTPMSSQGTEMGAGPGGPNPLLSPDQGAIEQQPGMPGGSQDMEGQAGMDQEGGEAPQATPGSAEAGPTGELSQRPSANAVSRLPEPDEEDIKKYDLEIEEEKSSLDDEEVDEPELHGDDLDEY